MRLAVVVLMLLAEPAAPAQEEGAARQVLDACIDSLPSEVIGLEDMQESCPGLKAAIEQLGIAPLLPVNQHDLLTRNGLMNLRSLLQRYQQAPERGEIGIDGLQPALESLLQPPEAQRALSWYERFRRWLRDAFDRKEDQANPWLRRWFDEHPISETVRLALFYGVMLLVVVLAVLIIVNEVRAARAGRRKSGAATSANAAGSQALQLGRSDIDVRGDRPSVLLRMLIATLVKTGRLHRAHSLTHRELIARVQLEESAQQESFRRIAELAELEIFSGKPIASRDLDEAIRAGRHLNAQLMGAVP